MKQSDGLHINRDKAAGFAAALVLHAVVLYGLWSYHIIPPPTEALTVFVNFINPTSPAKTAQPQPVAPKAVPTRQEIPRPVTPAAPQLMTSPAPVTSPAQPVAPPPPVAKAVPAPTPVSTLVPPGAATVVGSAAGPQPVLLSGELSVSCTERTPPAYPKQSLRLGEQGKTVLLVELDELGRVANIEVKTKSGFPRLDEAAINAVKSWHCSPAKRNGVAVRSVALQPFNFALKGR
jgi:periplasmic protein TonB